MISESMAILVGCSGWSYDDWVGRFYPMALAKNKGAWLAYYAKYFRTVEINSTFYRPPGELQVSSWIKKGHDLSDFEYSLKMPKLVTHKSMVQGEASAAVHGAKAFEKTCVQSLGEAGLLGCVLLQLSHPTSRIRRVHNESWRRFWMPYLFATMIMPWSFVTAPGRKRERRRSTPMPCRS